MKSFLAVFLLINVTSLSFSQSDKNNRQKENMGNKDVQSTSEARYKEGASGVKRSISYRFSKIVTDSDPGPGTFRFDAQNLPEIKYLITGNNDVSGDDQTSWYKTWEDTTGATGRGRITMVEHHGENTIILDVSGVFIRRNGYWKIPVTYISGSPPIEDSIYYYVFSRIAHRGVEEVAEIVDVEDVVEVIDVAEVADVKDAIEVVEVVEAGEVDVVDTGEIAGAVDVVDVKDVVEDVVEVVEVEDVAEVADVSDVKDVVDVVEKVADVSDVKDVVDVVEKVEDVGEVIEAEDVAEVADAEEVVDVIDVIDVKEVKEVAEVAEVEEAVEVEDVAEVADVSDVKDVVDVVEKVEDVAELIEAEDVAEVADAEEVVEVVDVIDVKENKEVAEVAEVEEAVEVAKTKDAVEAEEVAEEKAPPVTEVIQAGEEKDPARVTEEIVQLAEDKKTQVPEKKPVLKAVPDEELQVRNDRRVPQNQNEPRMNDPEQRLRQISTTRQSPQQNEKKTAAPATAALPVDPVNHENETQHLETEKKTLPVIEETAALSEPDNPVSTQQKIAGKPDQADRNGQITSRPLTMDDAEENSQSSPPPTYNAGLPVYRPVTNQFSSPGNHGKCYSGIIEFGYASGVGEYGTDNFRFNFINGFHIGPTFTMGLGIGIRKYFVETGSDRYLVSGQFQMPVFIDLRKRFSAGKITPYLAFGLGSSASFVKDNDTTRTVNEGMLINPSGGIWFNISERFAVFAGVAYELQKLEFAFISDERHIKKNAGSVSVNLGISF